MRHLKYKRPESGERLVATLSGGDLSFGLAPDAAKETFHVNLAETIERHSVDHGVIAIGKKGDAVFAVETTTVSVAYRSNPYLGAVGTNRRDTPLSVYREASGETGCPVAYLLTPRKGCALDEATLYWFDSGLTTVDGSPLKCPDAPIAPEFLRAWMPIEIEGPESVIAGSTASYRVVAPAGVDVYLEATAGVLDRSRVRNGETVNLVTLAATATGPAKIKAGYRYWPGKSEKSITINVA